MNTSQQVNSPRTAKSPIEPRAAQRSPDRLSDDEPYLWLDERWDGDRDLVALPAHHIVLQRGLGNVTKGWMNSPPWHADRWPALALPDPTWNPAAPRGW